MKDHRWILLYRALIVGIVLLLPVWAWYHRTTETESPWGDSVETAKNEDGIENHREARQITEAEHYLADMFVVGFQRGDAGFDRELLQAIAQRREIIDPETGFPWGTHRQPQGYHSQFEFGTKVRPTRDAMNDAAMLIASPQEADQTEGRALLEKVIDLQDQDPESVTFGIWSWYYEESLAGMAAPDYNWADFLGAVLAALLHDYPDRLPPELLEKTQKSLEYCGRAIIKRDVKPSYTNIAMMGATVTAAAGELLDRQDLLDYGRMRILRNLDHFRTTGNFTEYNSPNYTPVVINELERMLYLVNDTTCRLAAAELLIGAWQTVAEHYHVPTSQWAGPFSRTYSDRITPRLRNTILAQALVLSPEELSELPVGVQPIFSPFAPRLTCPESLRHHFSEVPQDEITRRNVFNKTNADPEIGTTWMTPTATLASASYHTFWAQARGLIGYWVMPGESQTAVLKLSFLHNGNDFASGSARNRQSGGRVLTAFGLLRNQGSMHPTFDRPEDGVFHAESFEIVYQLTAKGATVRELAPNVFELSAGPMRAVLHVADHCFFAGHPVQWHVEVAGNIAKLVGTCYRGETTAFALDAMGETRIALGLELLRDDQHPTPAAVTISDAVTPQNRKGAYYAVTWEPVTGNAPLSTPLIAPAQVLER